jgi:predicted nuclease of restriction endonuclease-like (RecB) superfamily
MIKKTIAVIMSDMEAIDEVALFERIAAIIENRKSCAGTYANREVTLMYWEVGQYIRSVLLDGERAEYGKRIVTELASQLTKKYGKTFDVHNLRRMIRFAEKFPNFEIVTELALQLSWSHFIELLPLKSDAAIMYYANDVSTRNLGTKQLREQISRKVYERKEIANTEFAEQSTIPFNVFKDPYLLDVLGLKDNFLEADLEKAILTELEAFILEFGHGFAFVDRQKRMTINGDDIKLDLLLFHRKLRRLVAIELKIGRFKAAFKGQMELYLKWLDRYERQEGEEAPIGIILCASANRETVEMLEMNKAGIAVAEYWTELPPKVLLEEKLRTILAEAKERLERRNSLPAEGTQKQIEYFFDHKGDEDE